MSSSTPKVYQNSGHIYKIVNNDETKKYIGSTFSTLSKRFSQHKDNYKCFKNGKCGKNTAFDIFEEFGIENCKIILMATLHSPCTKQELLKLEQYYISNEFCVNKLPAYVSEEQKKEYTKSYYVQNKERIQEKQKDYNQVPENKLRKKVYEQERMKNPEVKEKRVSYLKEYNKKSETKILQREASKRYMSKPENKLKKKEYMADFRKTYSKTEEAKEKDKLRKKRAKTREKLAQLIYMAYNNKYKEYLLKFEGKRQIRVKSKKQLQEEKLVSQ